MELFSINILSFTDLSDSNAQRNENIRIGEYTVCKVCCKKRYFQTTYK